MYMVFLPMKVYRSLLAPCDLWNTAWIATILGCNLAVISVFIKKFLRFKIRFPFRNFCFMLYLISWTGIWALRWYSSKNNPEESVSWLFYNRFFCKGHELPKCEHTVFFYRNIMSSLYFLKYRLNKWGKHDKIDQLTQN